ncbi:MAG: hypothetical protein LBN01_04350 [Endomicrobium sp.]|jgi:hypothetical protein|nr:hypothetical protein [Endomicrobium sp.]
MKSHRINSLAYASNLGLITDKAVCNYITEQFITNGIDLRVKQMNDIERRFMTYADDDFND